CPCTEAPQGSRSASHRRWRWTDRHRLVDRAGVLQTAGLVHSGDPDRPGLVDDHGTAVAGHRVGDTAGNGQRRLHGGGRTDHSDGVWAGERLPIDDQTRWTVGEVRGRDDPYGGAGSARDLQRLGPGAAQLLDRFEYGPGPYRLTG